MKIKSRYIKVGICILVFFSLIGISNMLLHPIYNKIGAKFSGVLLSLNQKLEDKAGLRISYDSLSPSVLHGITLNGIVVYDSQSQLPIGSVQSLSLVYSVKDLLKGNLIDALKTFSLRDVEIDITEGVNDFWLKKAFQEKEALPDDLEIKTAEETKRLFEILEGLDFSLLKDVRIYRLHTIYKKQNAVFEGNISRASFTNNEQGTTDAKFNGDINGQIGAQSISCSTNFSAVIPKGFEGSSAVLRFGNITFSGYRARFLSFLAEYSNKNFNLKMLPGAQNIFAEFNAALETGDINAKFFADNFSVSRLVQASNPTQVTQSIFAMNFSVDANADYNINTKKLSYSSKGNVFIPAQAIPAKDYADDILVSFGLSGDENRLNVQHLATSSERYNFNFDGGFNYKTKRPNGNLYVESVVLPNGGVISTEVYIEPNARGFMCFSPQISFDDKTFTAAMLNIIQANETLDFTFEVSDYAHADSEQPGQISLFGSLSRATGTLQSSIAFNTVYLDSMMLMYAFFADPAVKPLLEKAADVASPFVFSCDSFVSGQGGDFAFNISYAFIANTVRDDQMLMLSADGNKENIHISRLEVAFAKQRILVNADGANLGEGQGRIINGRLELNDIPYDFTGIFNKDWVSINSEYGLQFTMNTDTSGEEAILSGIFSVADFPLKISDRTYSFSNETSFSYAVSNGLTVTIPRFEGRILDKTYLNPVISFSGTLDSQGLAVDGIAYSDKISTIAGNGNAFWFANEGILEEATFSFDLSDFSGVERIALFGNVSNPMQTPLSMGTLFSGEFIKNLFVNANFDITSLRSQRFVTSSRESDSINANLAVQGTLGNPFVTFEIPRAVFTVNNTPLVLRAQATVEDMIINAHDVSLDFGITQIKQLTAQFDARRFAGDMKFDLQTSLLGKKINTDVFATVEGLSESERGIPEVINLAFDTGEVIENNSKKTDPYHIGIVKMQDDIIISSSENIGVSGTVSNYKDIDIKVKNPLPFNVDIMGTVTRDEINLIFANVETSLPKILKGAGIKFVKVQKGNVTGGFAITGSPSNPSFSGSLDIVPAEFNFPYFFKKHASTNKITLLMDGSQFYTEPTRCTLHRSPIDVTVVVQMNRLAFESLDVHLQTVEENFVPLNINLSEIHVKGDFLTNMDINYEKGRIGITGDLTAKNTNAEFGATRLNEILAGLTPQTDDDDSWSVDAALNIKMLSRVQISYSSFLRALIVPNNDISVTYFSDQKRLLLDGDVPIRSGDITYLNTSFYIKEGRIHFSENDEGFDPRVSVRAETKVRDNNNENVTVSLVVDNQHLSQLSPRLTASPARSEREVMEILGNIITAESSNVGSLALATGDYAFQTVFTRKLENVLRDFFNFDIFSVRTMVVQNAVKQSMESRKSVDDSNPAGNYLDGTSVYIGKYLGDSLFADASLRLDYDENRVGDKYTLKGLSFRPEIGFELEAPFAKIRWSMSPDYEDIVNMRFVQNTALTLSWKINF